MLMGVQGEPGEQTLKGGKWAHVISTSMLGHGAGAQRDMDRIEKKALKIVSTVNLHS